MKVDRFLAKKWGFREVCFRGNTRYDALPGTTMKLSFTKMHGLGNDFVLLDGRDQPDSPWGKWAVQLLDRRFGVGADQLLVILPSKRADVFMGTFERDGRSSEMCGNGARCVARFLFEHSDSKKEWKVETPGGIKVIRVHDVDEIEVDMGPPAFEHSRQFPQIETWPFRTLIQGEELELFPVSMGNPHAVLFVENDTDLEKIQILGPKLESDPTFPEGVNCELVYVQDLHHVKVRVWERGAGETLACGTGACAVAAAAIQHGIAQSPVTVVFKGGALRLEWKPGSSMKMTGPATEVFQGEIDV